MRAAKDEAKAELGIYAPFELPRWGPGLMGGTAQWLAVVGSEGVGVGRVSILPFLWPSQ